jgi:FtsP/CotA-like multicopper oxidase with cupredoxin domain
VRLGDQVQVDVTNADVEGGTSVHWHGQDLPNAAWADGVAGVSQAPIPVGATFSYRFAAEPAGTFWYHSHTAEQFGDGLRGPLIVDDPADPHKSLYDYDLDEHVIMLADVFDAPVGDTLRELQTAGMGGAVEARAAGGGGVGGMAPPAAAAAPKMQGMGGMAPPAAPSMKGMGGTAPAAAAPSVSMGANPGRMLMQAPSMQGMGGAAAKPAAPAVGGGMGAAAPEPKAAMGTAQNMMGSPSDPAEPGGKMAALCAPEVLNQDISDAPWGGVRVNGRGAGAGAGEPLVLTVEAGKRYRMRLIGGMSSWALKVGVSGHSMQVIALDGRPVVPRKAEALLLTSGERADFVLAAGEHRADRVIARFADA